MMKNHPKFSSVCKPILFILIFWISACSGSKATSDVLTPPEPTATATQASTPVPTPTSEVIQGTISIWHSLNEPAISSLVQVIADFQTQYPDVQFDVLYLPENIILERYRTAVQEGTGPTLLLGSDRWAPDIQQNGMAADLKARLSEELTNRINPAGLDAGLIGEEQIGLPYSLEGTVLYRNKELILDTPGTWDDLIAQSQEITQGEEVGAFLDRGFYYSGGHLAGLGGTLINADGTPAFNSEEGLDWLELLISYEKAGPTDFLTSADFERFKLGQVGYLIENTTNREALKEAIGPLSLAIDPWPSYQDSKLAGYLVAQNVYLNEQAGDENSRLGWLFAEYLLSPQAQLNLSKAGLIPAVLDAPVEDPLIAQVVTALAGNVVYPNSPQMELYRTALDTALQSVFSGASTPADALAAAQASIEAALAGPTPTPTP